MTSDDEPAPRALDFLDATGSEAASFLDDAKAVISQRTEKPTELHRGYSFRPASLHEAKGKRIRVPLLATGPRCCNKRHDGRIDQDRGK